MVWIRWKWYVQDRSLQSISVFNCGWGNVNSWLILFWVLSQTMHSTQFFPTTIHIMFVMDIWAFKIPRTELVNARSIKVNGVELKKKKKKVAWNDVRIIQGGKHHKSTCWLFFLFLPAFSTYSNSEMRCQ